MSSFVSPKELINLNNSSTREKQALACMSLLEALRSRNLPDEWFIHGMKIYQSPFLHTTGRRRTRMPADVWEGIFEATRKLGGLKARKFERVASICFADIMFILSVVMVVSSLLELSSFNKCGAAKELCSLTFCRFINLSANNQAKLTDIIVTAITTSISVFLLRCRLLIFLFVLVLGVVGFTIINRQ